MLVLILGYALLVGTVPAFKGVVNSYDPDDGQHSLLKTAVGLPLSLQQNTQQLVDSKVQILFTVKLRALTHVTNQEINFFLKGHIK